MINNLLNSDYHRLLVQTFSENVEFNSSLLPISCFNKINLSFIQKAINKTSGFDIILKVPKCFDRILEELYTNIYLFVANSQFYENYINPDLGSVKFLVPRQGLKNRKYKVKNISGDKVYLIEDRKESLNYMDGPAKVTINKKNILKQFIIVERPVKKSSLSRYFELFGSLNQLDVKVDFFPTKFDSVSIIIGAKKIFDSFRNVSIQNGNLYNSIPCHYINRDGKESDTLGIEPLLYFAPSYSIAFQKIINNEQNKVKVSNIVLLNDGFDELQQIISDQNDPKYCFKILGICGSPIENRVGAIKYWEWHKEEINLIESI